MGFLVNSNTASDPGSVNVRQSAQAMASGIAPQYQLILNVAGDPTIIKGVNVFPIVASLPERYNISMSSMWDAPFANNSIGETLTKNSTEQGIINQGLAFAGIGTRHKYQLAQVWQSSSPISFNFDFVFNAKTNTEQDVKFKHLALLKLAAPGEEGGILLAPGPNARESAVSGRQLSLTIGTYLHLDNVIVKNVSSDIQTLCGPDGIPHAITMNVEFETFFAGVTTSDLDAIFGV